MEIYWYHLYKQHGICWMEGNYLYFNQISLLYDDISCEDMVNEFRWLNNLSFKWILLIASLVAVTCWRSIDAKYNSKIINSAQQVSRFKLQSFSGNVQTDDEWNDQPEIIYEKR